MSEPPRDRLSFAIQMQASAAIRYKSMTNWAVSGREISSRPKANSDCSALSIVQPVYIEKSTSDASAMRRSTIVLSLVGFPGTVVVGLLALNDL
ncbi:hypothetical protein D3C80_1739990 [compost metagenome]